MDTFRFVLPHARRYAPWYTAGLLLVPLSAAATLGIPRVTGAAISVFEQAPGWNLRELYPLLTLLLGLAALAGITLFAIRWLIIGASRHIEYDIRNDLFRHLQRLDQSYYNTARTGDIMSRATSDVERVRLLAGPIILYASRTGFMLALGIPLMLHVSWELTVMVMVPLSLMTVAVRLIGPKVHRETFRAQETLAELSSIGQENFSGIRVVKSFAREDHERGLFAQVSRKYLDQNMRAAAVSAWMQPIVGGVNDLALLSLLLVGGILILRDRLDYHQFVEFAGYQIVLIWPMLSIGWVVNQYHRARASVDRLRELMEIEPRVREPEHPRLPSGGRIRGDIAVRDLTFGYNGRPILDGITMEAPAGSTVAIVGPTGAGKSTLVHMIPRILPVPAGTVFVDGIDVTLLSLRFLRRSIGMVPQESFLFSRTVRENIAFGTVGAELDTIYGMAQVARFDKDIDQFPQGYEAMVGERGVTLSGGQKQRAALARALMIRPRILILDDAFSAVDAQTEEEILRNLHRVSRDMTTLVVSHRVSGIAHADAIYVIDEGHIVETGTHGELLARGGLYAEIHHLQQISDELESL